MAKLPQEITETIWQLKIQSLEIIEQATSAEFILFDSFGETEEILPYLDEMKNVAESATSFYTRLSNIHLQITQAQPWASNDLLRLLYQTIEITLSRLPALERSIEEVKQEWSLP